MSAPTFLPNFKIPTTAGFTLAVSCSLLISCGNSSTSNLASKSLNKVTSLWPSRVPIAEVRQKDLKKMPSGADRALAWNRSLNQWVYMPVDYNPPALPEDPTYPIDGGLLPPLQPCQGSTAEGRGQVPEE